MVLNNEQIQQKLTETNHWDIRDGKIFRLFNFNDFKEAMNFVNKVADEAEEMDHHPDINISYNKVELNLRTHSEHGLTEKDFTLANKINQL
jgi:4a-hydroxytetrahydrobiopterin dehydratase